ncbi:MAG TPA: hypothetical protein VHN20_05870 [Beijerinckiaceae bacterium]|nr:hypothetical protein [Beijerinckiaceae bacterium]
MIRADWLTWVTLALFAIWLLAVLRLGVAAEIHHAWLGLPAVSPEVWWPLRIVCALVLLDDAMQHVRQLRDRSYRSPLHRLAARLRII